ncbi:hypothetical protein FBEOM_9684 [Fusarium beomiforme]|uniref:Uncharacterized protein n=1 Tax=Fusarium beomiforme TaxID=44412 RepID=A0A9P5DTC9_9HYPO|nr:hypothetical protein FBEOM_9684 [Fusarium beomiforme]
MSSKQKPSKHSSSRKGSSSSQTGPSFLFITNKLVINNPERDYYHHLIPPSSPNSYRGEVPSKVMRYRNGDISEATNYLWYRESSTPPASQGQLLRMDGHGNCPTDRYGNYYSAEEYKTFGVAACNPLLPIMVTEQDPLVTTSNWELLRVFHPPSLPGVSQVSTISSSMGPGGGPLLHVAGRSPAWIPGLLPATYRSPQRHAPPSQGLGGELPIILGLMALNAPPGGEMSNHSIDAVFLGHNRLWRHGAWTSSDPPRGHPPTASEDPKGFIVKVFLDPENPYSTRDELRSLEWERVIVRD